MVRGKRYFAVVAQGKCGYFGYVTDFYPKDRQLYIDEAVGHYGDTIVGEYDRKDHARGAVELALLSDGTRH